MKLSISILKSVLSHNEIFSVLSAHHNVSLSILQLKRIFKKLGLSRRTTKSSINDDIAFVINELESSSRCLRYGAMHQKLLMDSFINDHQSVRLILKERDHVGVAEKSRHSLIRRTYISTGSNHTYHIDGYNKLKPFKLLIHGAIGGCIRKLYGCL